MTSIVARQDAPFFQVNSITTPEAKYPVGDTHHTNRRTGKNIAQSHSVIQQEDVFLPGDTSNVNHPKTYNYQAQFTHNSHASLSFSGSTDLSTSSESPAENVAGTRRPRRHTDGITPPPLSDSNKTIRTMFSYLHQQVEQDRRITHILVQALIQSRQMTENEIDAIKLDFKLFMDDIANIYAHFSEEKTLVIFIQDRLKHAARGVADFWNNKNLISRHISVNPNAIDSELIDFAKSLLKNNNENELLPVNISEPFISYSDELLKDLNWIDWKKASRNVHTPLQAIHALYVFNYNRIYPKLDGLIIGEGLAKGDKHFHVTARMSNPQKAQLDKAALLFALANDPNLKLQDHPTLALGDQLLHIRKNFLSALRDEWLMSQMFLPNSTRSNVFFDHNALIHAKGKTIADLINDESITRIPGMNTLSQQTRENLVKQKLNRLGESTEYKFGTLQHGMATVLKRSWLLQGKVVPNSFGTEMEMVGKFLALCRTWETKQAVMLNPKLMLAQYLTHASGENITLGMTTSQQKIAALEDYLAERWLANYGEPPERFNSDTALLALMKKAASRNLGIPEKTFLNVGWRKFRARVFNPESQLQTAKQEYNQALLTNSWILARAKERIRVSGRVLDANTLQTERVQLIDYFHVEIESYQERNAVLRFIKDQPIISNIWRFLEGIYTGNPEEIIGAIPVVGNVYEFEEGVRHGDTARAISAIPIIGSGYRLEEALRKGDGIDVTLSGEAFILDLAMAKGGLTDDEAEGHTVLKETELPTAHAIGLRNYLSLSKAVDIPLRGTEYLESLSENSPHTRSILPPGDLYDIESDITQHELQTEASSSTASASAFGPDMERYHAPGPREGILPNDHGIYLDESAKYIKSGEHYYRVRYDTDNGTWQVYFPENLTKPAVPVRYVNGEWEIHSDTGIKGGNPINEGTPANIPSMNELYNPEMASKDKFHDARRETLAQIYKDIKGKKRYEQSFDVEGNPAIHLMKANKYRPGQPYFDIDVHGCPILVRSIEGKVVGPKTFAEHIRRYVRYYEPGTPIRLFSCNTARGGRFSFAQRFANAMNVPVKAYTIKVHQSFSEAYLEKHAKVFHPIGG
ncbi:hypothetical protein ACUHMQ_02350 [Chitinimonas sp. PSY-7]|uniref:hypothetical protein n=1 Tax=Chitinimonas sp. PSY-7 TaxID=3459088 RepID=UPI00403FD504